MWQPEKQEIIDWIQIFSLKYKKVDSIWRFAQHNIFMIVLLNFSSFFFEWFFQKISFYFEYNLIQQITLTDTKQQQKIWNFNFPWMTSDGNNLHQIFYFFWSVVHSKFVGIRFTLTFIEFSFERKKICLNDEILYFIKKYLKKHVNILNYSLLCSYMRET